MKKLVLIVCFSILLTQAHAQKESQEKEISIDSMLVNIDKSTFTSGILYDRVAGLSQAFQFNKNPKNTATVNYFEQVLNDLYKASNEKKLVNYKEYRKKYANKKASNTVDIGIINASFHQLNYNENSGEKSGLSFNGKQFTQKEGKTPFVAHHIFIASLLKNYVVGQDITFNFGSDFLIQESEKQLVSLTADFGFGKTVVLMKNKSIANRSFTIHYNETGYKTVLFKATFNDGTKITTKGKVHVKIQNRAFMRDPIIDGTFDSIHNATEAFQGYEPDDTTPPIKGRLEYRIFYHEDGNGEYERRLLKPIVIIDGFDPQDTRKISDADSDKPADEHTSIEEMMRYKEDNGTPRDIIRILREQGYDVIVVNHPTYTKNGYEIDGGADYIERNALAHASFYQYLNNTILGNGSSEELVIIGPSMGGQISRYALAYMEKEGIDHNVRLWVSVDSPHLGANIPIGMQSMINLLATFGDSVGANDIYNDRLKATASNQQLIEQHLPNNSSDYLNGGSQVHQTYYNNLKSNGLQGSGGYPQNLRKIALVNGSLIGKKVGGYGEEDFRIHGFADHVIGGNVKVTEMNTKYMPDTGGRIQVARLWRLSKPTRIATYTNNNRNGSMDVVSGGLFNTEDILHASVMDQGLDIYDDIYGYGDGIQLFDIFLSGLGTILGFNNAHFESRTNKGVHTFIPTVSALGFKNPNFKWGERIDPSLLCDDEIPFDTFFAPKDNERHTSFTEASVNWLFEELAGNHQSIPNYNNPTMAGESEVYTGQTVTYTIPKTAKASTYIWDLDFNYPPNTPLNSIIPWRILNGQGTNSITVRAGSPIVGVISCRPKNSCATGRMIYKYVRSYNTAGGGGGGDDNPCDDNFGKFTISPNPSNGHAITIIPYPTDPCDNNLPTKQQVKNTVEIFDIYGVKKYSGIHASTKFKISSLNLKAGLYIVRLISVNGISKEKMLMVE